MLLSLMAGMLLSCMFPGLYCLIAQESVDTPLMLSLSQYAPTMKPLLYMVNVAMASYEQWYNADRGDSIVRQLVTSIFKGGKYVQVLYMIHKCNL